LEMQEPAERALPHRRDMHRHALTADCCVIDAPFGLAIAPRGALEQLECCCRRLAGRGVGKRIGRVLVKDAPGVREGTRRRQRGMTHLVEPIHRRREKRTAVARQRGCPAEFANWHVVWPRPDFLHCSRVSFFGHKSTRKVGRAPIAHGKVCAGLMNYSPVCISEPLRRAEARSARNAKTASENSTILSANACTIRSARKLWSISNARMPSNT